VKRSEVMQCSDGLNNVSNIVRRLMDSMKLLLISNFCVVVCIICFVSFSVLFLCICVLYYCHRVAIQLQLNYIVPYHPIRQRS
jgi:hypothetical protein